MIVIEKDIHWDSADSPCDQVCSLGRSSVQTAVVDALAMVIQALGLYA